MRSQSVGLTIWPSNLPPRRIDDSRALWAGCASRSCASCTAIDCVNNGIAISNHKRRRATRYDILHLAARLEIEAGGSRPTEATAYLGELQASGGHSVAYVGM